MVLINCKKISELKKRLSIKQSVSAKAEVNSLNGVNKCWICKQEFSFNRKLVFILLYLFYWSIYDKVVINNGTNLRQSSFPPRYRDIWDLLAVHIYIRHWRAKSEVVVRWNNNRQRWTSDGLRRRGEVVEFRAIMPSIFLWSTIVIRKTPRQQTFL